MKRLTLCAFIIIGMLFAQGCGGNALIPMPVNAEEASAPVAESSETTTERTCEPPTFWVPDNGNSRTVEVDAESSYTLSFDGYSTVTLTTRHGGTEDVVNHTETDGFSGIVVTIPTGNESSVQVDDTLGICTSEDGSGQMYHYDPFQLPPPDNAG